MEFNKIANEFAAKDNVESFTYSKNVTVYSCSDYGRDTWDIDSEFSIFNE